METYKDNGRKFLLQSLPSKEFFNEFTHVVVKIGYLRKDGDDDLKIIERTRYDGEKECWIINKISPIDEARQAQKLVIDEETFQFLFNCTNGQRIHKERFTCTNIEGFILKFDRYLKPTKKGLIILLEVDLAPGGHTLSDFILPSSIEWAENAVEVTDDPQYFNKNLAC